MLTLIIFAASLFVYPETGPFGHEWGAPMSEVEAATGQEGQLIDVESGTWRIIHLSGDYGMVNYFFDYQFRLNAVSIMYDRDLTEDEAKAALAQHWREEGRNPRDRRSRYDFMVLGWQHGIDGGYEIEAVRVEDGSWWVWKGYMKSLPDGDEDDPKGECKPNCVSSHGVESPPGGSHGEEETGQARRDHR